MALDSRHILTIRAFQIAEAIDIKKCRVDFPGDLVASAPQELFFRRKASPENGSGEREQGYLYILDYGVVICAGLQRGRAPHCDALRGAICWSGSSSV